MIGSNCIVFFPVVFMFVRAAPPAVSSGSGNEARVAKLQMHPGVGQQTNLGNPEQIQQGPMPAAGTNYDSYSRSVATSQ